LPIWLMNRLDDRLSMTMNDDGLTLHTLTFFVVGCAKVERRSRHPVECGVYLAGKGIHTIRTIFYDSKGRRGSDQMGDNCSSGITSFVVYHRHNNEKTPARHSVRGFRRVIVYCRHYMPSPPSLAFRASSAFRCS